MGERERYDDLPFTVAADRRSRLTSTAAQVGGDRPRVLDLGCGTGEQLLDLLDALPGAHGMGVDISGPNIAVAEAGDHPRAAFRRCDYLTTALGQFDVIISDSVLHLLPGPADVMAKIAGDLRPGGVLVATLPRDCPYNHVLAAVRRLARLLPRRAVDRVALAVAGVLHRGRDRAFLLERLNYLYVLPTMYGGPRLWAAAERAGLAVESFEPVEHASPAQMKHGLLVLRRETV